MVMQAPLNAVDRKLIDYQDLAICFAYAYKYTTPHGDYVVQVLTLLRQLLGAAVFNNETARVSCISCHRGSDII